MEKCGPSCRERGESQCREPGDAQGKLRTSAPGGTRGGGVQGRGWESRFVRGTAGFQRGGGRGLGAGAIGRRRLRPDHLLPGLPQAGAGALETDCRRFGCQL